MSEKTIAELPGIGAKTAESLRAAGFDTIAAIAAAAVDDLSAVKGFGPARAARLIDSAKAMSVATEATAADPTPEPAATVTPMATPAKPARKPFPLGTVALAAAATAAIAIVGLGMADQEPFRDFVGVKQIKAIFAEEVKRTQTADADAAKTPPPVDVAISTPEPKTAAQATTEVTAGTGFASATTTPPGTPSQVAAQAMAAGQPMPFAAYPMPHYGMPPAPFRAASRSGADAAANDTEAHRDAGTAQANRPPMPGQAWHPVYPGNWSHGGGNGNFAGSFGFSTRQRFHGNGLHHPAWGAPYPYAYAPAYPRTAWQPITDAEKAGG